MAMEQAESERRAISRALSRRGTAAVRRLKYGVYTVASHSRPEAWHTVTVDGTGRYRCDCAAGLAGRPCWHQALIYVRKVEHGGGRVTGPASSGSPAAPARPGVGTLASAA
jgi:hypothetical protein